MEYVFLTLLAALLLIPILFVIRGKLGLSIAGIITITVLSWLFVVLALVMQGFMPVWKNALLIVLLALSFSYLLQKKLESVLFVSKATESVEEYEVVSGVEALQVEELENYTYKQFMEKYNTPNGDKIESLFEPKVDKDESTDNPIVYSELSYLEELFQQDFERKKEGTEL